MAASLPVAHAVPVPQNSRGFDANAVVSLADAMRFVRAGYTFAIRYVPRVSPRGNDLSSSEMQSILSSGLGLMIVQHVESETSWTPNEDKGNLYGQTAANYCTSIGVPSGTTVWLDLEGVALGVSGDDVVRYCNAWFGHVQDAGYLPGLYCGWHCGLSASDLYRRLKFSRFWLAYNLNADEAPIVRGACLRQVSAKPPAGIAYPIDGDVALMDKLGGVPTMAVSLALAAA